MDQREEINQYDLVEITRVPEQYAGVIDVGDIGVVVEKYDDENFEIECIRPGDECTWLARLNISYVKLRSKDPYHPWVQKSLKEKPIMQTSILLGIGIGAAFGGLIGAGFGATTMTLKGVLIGLVIGLLLGIVTGALTAALTAKIGGTTGGVGAGYFIGMLSGGIFGMIVGALLPTSLRMSSSTESPQVLDVLMMSRFETVMFVSFLLSILGTMVGAWVGGKNLIPRNLKERYRP